MACSIGYLSTDWQSLQALHCRCGAHAHFTSLFLPSIHFYARGNINTFCWSTMWPYKNVLIFLIKVFSKKNRTCYLSAGHENNIQISTFWRKYNSFLVPPLVGGWLTDWPSRIHKGIGEFFMPLILYSRISSAKWSQCVFIASGRKLEGFEGDIVLVGGIFCW